MSVCVWHTLQNVLFGAFVEAISWMPSIIPLAMKLLMKYGNPLPDYNRVDLSHNVFNLPHYIPRHHEAEVIVGIEDCSPAITELRALTLEEKMPVNFITEVSVCVVRPAQHTPNVVGVLYIKL